MPLKMSLYQMSLLLFTFHIKIRWEMKFQTNIESGLSLQINLMEVFIFKPKNVCVRKHAHTDTHTHFQTRSINLKEICRSTTKVSSPTFYHSLITHNCFLIEGKSLFLTNRGLKKNLNWCVVFFFFGVFFCCMSLLNISLV
jgi:hypothetical protein